MTLTLDFNNHEIHNMKTSSKAELSIPSKTAVQVNTRPSLWIAVSSLSLGIIMSVNLSIPVYEFSESELILPPIEKPLISGSHSSFPKIQADTLTLVRP